MKEEKKEQIVTIVKYENGKMSIEIKANLSGEELLEAFSAFTIVVLDAVPAAAEAAEKKRDSVSISRNLKRLCRRCSRYGGK